ncbi:SpoIIE family protein phosphatase [Streptomyces cavernae]|uniref:SpoIIE family protein phosphatase n=1 Tax=Streptomyces cavernae TaxID=2259034 RepID=UPI001EE44AC5|nr:SpoIIE family protein phosphatase [Streptomyces cavernae]
MTSESAIPGGPGPLPDVVALAKVVAKQRAELAVLRDQVAASAVVERAKGALMALTGCPADTAQEELARRAAAQGRSLIEECWVTLGSIRVGTPAGAASTAPSNARTPAGDASTASSSAGASTAPSTVRTPAGDASTASSTSGVAGARTASGGSRSGSLREGGSSATPESAPGGPGTAAEGARGDGHAEVLRRIGEALLRVRTPQDLAGCLLELLADPVGADAVMVFSAGRSGGLELVGHAGIGETLATQWAQVPPLSGIAALEVIRTQAPCWLENLERDRKQYLLIGDPPERWRSRAWLPVVTGDAVTTSFGILRTRDEPFTPSVRSLLLEVARLCAGRIQSFDTSYERAAGQVAELVQSVFETLAEPAVLLTPLRSPSGAVEDFRIDAAAPRSVDIAGRRGRELVGLRVLECYPTVAGEPLWQGYLDTLRTGEPYEAEPFEYQEVVSGVPESSTYSVRAVRLGDALVVTWVRHDPSDRQEQRLADVQRLGNLGWADWNLVTGRINWSPQVFTIFGRPTELGPIPLTGLPDHLLPEDAALVGRALQALLREGRPVDVPFRIRSTTGTRHLRFVAETVTDADGTPVEVHGFVQDLTAQRSAELALIESERAMLTQHGVLQAERTLAARLQHALLPLPRRPQLLAGLRVDIAYLPAQSGIHVGGDWFSAIELPDGSALFVVGDVAGHGIDAVATMAQLRFTAKGMVITGSSLTGALARLNSLLLHTRDTNATATMVLARYTPEERRLVWAQAGHPPPLLLRDGEVRYLPRPSGMLLGATAAPSFAEAECRLEPGDRLLFYTDGLVERPSEGIDRGFERLAEAAGSLRTAGTEPLHVLLDRMLEGERRDDVCVLGLHLPADDAGGRP